MPELDEEELPLLEDELEELPELEDEPELPPELEDSVNRLKKGQVTEPVRTEYGYQIAQLTSFTPAKTKPLSEVRNALVKILRERKGEERYYDMAERFNNLVYEQPDSLEPAAKTLGLKIQKSGWLSALKSHALSKREKKKVVEV